MVYIPKGVGHIATHFFQNRNKKPKKIFLHTDCHTRTHRNAHTATHPGTHRGTGERHICARAHTCEPTHPPVCVNAPHQLFDGSGDGLRAEAHAFGPRVVAELIRVAPHERLNVWHRPQILRSTALPCVPKKGPQVANGGGVRPLGKSYTGRNPRLWFNRHRFCQQSKGRNRIVRIFCMRI